MVLEATVSRVAAEHFGGHPILFSDSIDKLNEQMAFVDKALGHYNVRARQAHFAELTRGSVCNCLTPLVDQQVSATVLDAKATMLASRGEKTELRDTFNELDTICTLRETRSDAPQS